MYLLASLIMQNFYKKVLQLIQSYKDVRYFWDQNSPFILNKFFWCKPLLLLSSTCWPFSLYKVLKSSYNGSRIITMHYFWDQSGPFAPNKFFFWNTVTINLIYLLTHFIVQKLKKNSSSRSSYDDVQIMGPKWPISPNKIFFRKPANGPCFFY